MRQFIRLLCMIVLLVLSGCETADLQPETKDKELGSATPIDELVDTDHFRTGALVHILEGEINRNQQAVGFHYEGLPDANGEVIQGSSTSLDKHGVYEAKVIINDVEKTSNQGKSSFFPKDLDSQDVVDSINKAYEYKVHTNGNTYEGLTEEGITVRMYLDQQEKIISAFPEYEGR